MLNEKKIEKHLVNECKRIGALCEKFTSPNRRNVPDRIVSYAGRVFFIELKAPNKKLSPAQKRDLDRRRKIGLFAACFHNEKDITEFINAIYYQKIRVETLPAFGS